MLIRVTDIHKQYDSLEVLKGVSLDIAEREVVTIVGPSGAGKTTLLNIMGSLEPQDKGKVEIDGTDLSALREQALSRFRNRNIGFVFQFHQLLPEFNVVENVAMPALIGGTATAEAFDKARKLIDYLGLSEREQHKPSQLSGGERQRVAVARALANSPKVVLADEPSGSLDSHNRQQLHRLFFDLRRDFGQTFVIVTHDESLASMSDRTVHLSDGRITEITTAAPQKHN